MTTLKRTTEDLSSMRHEIGLRVNAEEYQYKIVLETLAGLTSDSHWRINCSKYYTTHTFDNSKTRQQQQKKEGQNHLDIK